MSEYKLMSEEQLAAYRRIANNWADCNGDEARLRDCLGRCVAHIDSQAKLIELNDQLLADRNRLLAMFDCPCHGPCVPYAMEQVTAMRAENAGLKQKLALVAWDRTPGLPPVPVTQGRYDAVRNLRDEYEQAWQDASAKCEHLNRVIATVVEFLDADLKAAARELLEMP